MRAIYGVILIFIFPLALSAFSFENGKVTDSIIKNPATFRQLNHFIKLSALPDYHTLRMQYELASYDNLSAGLMGFYSPNGIRGKFKNSQWYGFAPTVRIYTSVKRKAAGFYIQIHAPFNKYNDQEIHYKSIKAYEKGTFITTTYHKEQIIKQSYNSKGIGLSPGLQLKLSNRIYADISLTYEQLLRPSSVKRFLYFPDVITGYRELYEDSESWSHVYGNIFFVVKL